MGEKRLQPQWIVIDISNQSRSINKFYIFKFCSALNNPCQNGCDCVRHDYSVYDSRCTFDCDYTCKNLAGKLHLGKSCEFAEPELDCNFDHIDLKLSQDVVKAKAPLAKIDVFNGLVMVQNTNFFQKCYAEIEKI